MVERDRVSVRRIVRGGLIAVLASWTLVLVLHEIPIGGVWLPIEASTSTLLICWPLVFAFAYLTAPARNILVQDAIQNAGAHNALSKTVAITAAIGALGALLVIFEFAYLRGYGFSASAAQIRMEEVSNNMKGLNVASPISGIGRLMIPAILPALIVAAANFGKLNGAARVILLVCLLILLFEQVAFEGGRTFLAASFLTTVVAFLVGRDRSDFNVRKTVSRPPYLRFAVTGAALMYFFLSVFISRVYDGGGFLWSHYRTFSQDFRIFVGTDVIARFDGFFGPFWYAVSMLWLYITQGINELDTLLISQDIPRSLGLYQFPQISPILQIVFGTEVTYDFIRILPNAGTYLTIYGANFLDFGHIGAFMSAALLGYLTARSIGFFASLRLNGLAICGPMLLTIALFSPVISILGTLAPAFFWAFGFAVIMKAQTPIMPSEPSAARTGRRAQSL
jgi:hypothetical protein